MAEAQHPGDEQEEGDRGEEVRGQKGSQEVGRDPSTQRGEKEAGQPCLAELRRQVRMTPYLLNQTVKKFLEISRANSLL